MSDGQTVELSAAADPCPTCRVIPTEVTILFREGMVHHEGLAKITDPDRYAGYRLSCGHDVKTWAHDVDGYHWVTS